MRMLGIDLASQPTRTAACLLDWHDGRVVGCALERGCDDATLDALARQADAIGIDAPFGWPRPFREAVGSWKHESWDTDLRDRLRFRETDRFVQRLHPENRPLSVSTDLVSLPGMRAMAFLRRHGVTDLSGDGRYFEVYPAASLRAWSLPATGYKKARDPKSTALRREIVARLTGRFGPFDPPEEILADADCLDAWIAAATACLAALGQTHPADEHARESAREEGWIHVPRMSG